MWQATIPSGTLRDHGGKRGAHGMLYGERGDRQCRADAAGRSRMPTHPFPTDPVKRTPDESKKSIPEDTDPAGSTEEMPAAQSLVESVRLEVEALRAMLGLSKNKKPDAPS